LPAGPEASSDSAAIPGDPRERLAPPPRAVFEEVAVLPGVSIPGFEPWSPRGARLLVNTSDGLAALDAESPGAGLVPLADFRVEYVSWSPDGEWVLGLHREYPTFIDRLFCIPLDGSGPVEMYAGEDCSPFLWGSSGDLVFWTDRHAESPERLPPPPEWTNANPGPWPVRPQCASAPRERLRPHDPTLWPSTYRVEAAEVIIRPFEAPVPDVYYFFLRDEVTDGRTVLTWGASPSLASTFTAIQSPEAGAGVRVMVPEWKDLGDGSFRIDFIPRCISADGRYLAGTSTVEDGHYVYESDILIEAADGSWRVPLQGAEDGAPDHFSREGSWLVWEPLHGSDHHVGRVRIGPGG
jgi:hypothetical protein